MSRDRIIPYTIQLHVRGMRTSPAEWYTRSRFGRPADGKPTRENIARYVVSYEASTQPGGVNEHVARAFGPQVVEYAEITHQTAPDGPRVVATWEQN